MYQIIPPPEILEFYRQVKQFGKLYLVGGSIRDLILGITPYDYDLIFFGNITELKKQFSFFIPSSRNDETIIFFKDGIEFQITFPKISLKEDLSRRDFTINSIAYDFGKEKIIDYFDGINDIKRRVIKLTDSSGKGLVADPVRIIRAYRLKNKLGFNIESVSESVIRKNIYLLGGIQKIRIGKEFVKVLKYEFPSGFFLVLRDKGILPFVFPELSAMVGVTQNKYHKYDVFSHTMVVLDAVPSIIDVRLAALFHDTGKPFVKLWNNDKKDFTFYNHEQLSAKISDKVLKEWGIETKIRKTAVTLVKNHMFYHYEEWLDKTVRKFISKVGEDNIDKIFYLRKADRAGTGSFKEFEDLESLKKRIDAELEKNGVITVNDLDISGYEIMDLGLKGKQIGMAKKYLFDIIMESPEKNNKKILIELLKNNLKLFKEY